MIDPRNIPTAVEWADLSTPDIINVGFGLIPRLITDGDWQEWAESLIHLQPKGLRLPSDPRVYTDWRDWAVKFNQAIFT